MKLTNFAISRRGLFLWNKFLDTTLKEIESLPLFKAKAKETLSSFALLMILNLMFF